jgi:hypothetical protein
MYFRGQPRIYIYMECAYLKALGERLDPSPTSTVIAGIFDARP